MKWSIGMGQTILQVENVTKKYKEKTVLDAVSFTMEQGDIIGLIGGNGAGKTTLMRVISGIVMPDEGETAVLGGMQEKQIGVMIEGPNVYNDMSGIENLRFFGRLFGEGDEETFSNLLQMVGLADAGKKKAGKYSLGMRQRLGIAIALLGDVGLLVLDEPFNGLDAQGIADLEQILTRINKEKGISILISSHIIGELTKICNRYLLLNQGRICRKYTHAELLKQAGSEEQIENYIVSSLGGAV